MQTYRRLVKYVQYAYEAGAYLCGKPYPLRFSARKRGRRTRKREVIETHVYKEAQPRVKLLYYLRRYHSLGLCELEPSYKLPRLQYVHIAKLRDVLAAYRYGKRFGLEPLASAGGTGRVPHICFELLLCRFGGGLPESPLQVGNYPLKRSIEAAAAVFALIANVQALVARAVQYGFSSFGSDILPRRIHGKAVFLADRGKVHIRHGILRRALPARYGYRAFS